MRISHEVRAARTLAAGAERGVTYIPPDVFFLPGEGGRETRNARSYTRAEGEAS